MQKHTKQPVQSIQHSTKDFLTTDQFNIGTLLATMQLEMKNIYNASFLTDTLKDWNHCNNTKETKLWAFPTQPLYQEPSNNKAECLKYARKVKHFCICE